MIGWREMVYVKHSLQRSALLLLLCSATHVQAGPCSDALDAILKSDTDFASERPYPILCNWNLVFAFERKLLDLGDLETPRTAKEFHDPIDPEAIRAAQARLGMVQTGVLSMDLFINYMQIGQ